MSGEPTAESNALLEAKRQTAIAAVDCLLRACDGHEHVHWLSRFRQVADDLRDGRLTDAVFNQCRMADSAGRKFGEPRWVCSRELAEEVRAAISSIRTHLYFADQSPPMTLPPETCDVRSKGTILQEERNLMASVPPIRHDPIEDNADFFPILADAERQAEELLQDHPFKNQLGYCHFFWLAKQQILREQYGIEWKTPIELNSNVIFD